MVAKRATRKTATVKPGDSTLGSLTVGELFGRMKNSIVPIVVSGTIFAVGIFVGLKWSEQSAPNPGPGPNPGPHVNPFEGLAEESCDLALACESNDRAHEARAMAGALDGIVDQIDKGDLVTLREAFKAAKADVNQAISPSNQRYWEHWSAGVDRILMKFHQAGNLVTAKDAGKAFTEIARGLSMSAEQ